MDLTKISLEQFLASSSQNVSPPALPPRDIFIKPGTGQNLPALRTNGNYSIVLIDQEAGDVAAIDGNGNEAGYYSDNSLIVHQGHQRKGLATALVLWAYKFRKNLPTCRSLTSEGRSALASAWHVANGNKTNNWWP